MIDLEIPQNSSLWKRLKGALSWFDTLWSVIGFFGWKPFVVATALAAGGWIWGYLRHEPVVTLSMGATTFFIALIYVAKLPAISNLLGERPHYKVWSRLQSLALWQAACLFAEVSPPAAMSSFLPNSEADAYFNLLVEGVRSGDLERVKTGNPAESDLITYGTIVTSASLRTYAGRHGLAPRFLQIASR